jgi:hypothetical protein
MTELDSDFWGKNRFGGRSPGNGGGVKTTNPTPSLDFPWDPDGELMPAPGAFPGSEPGGPASGEPIDPNRGGQGV